MTATAAAAADNRNETPVLPLYVRHHALLGTNRGYWSPYTTSTIYEGEDNALARTTSMRLLLHTLRIESKFVDPAVRSLRFYRTTTLFFPRRKLRFPSSFTLASSIPSSMGCLQRVQIQAINQYSSAALRAFAICILWELSCTLDQFLQTGNVEKFSR